MIKVHRWFVIFTIRTHITPIDAKNDAEKMMRSTVATAECEQ